MGRSCFLGVLILLALLVISVCHGYAAKLMETVEFQDASVHAEGTIGKSKASMVEAMDYQLDPGPNTNPKTGFVVPPPPRG